MQAALVNAGLAPSSTLSFIQGLATSCIAFFAIVNARLVRRLGARNSGIVGCLLFSSGQILSGFAVNNVGGLFVTAGVMMGVGLSLLFMVSHRLLLRMDLAIHSTAISLKTDPPTPSPKPGHIHHARSIFCKTSRPREWDHLLLWRVWGCRFIVHARCSCSQIWTRMDVQDQRIHYARSDVTHDAFVEREECSDESAGVASVVSWNNCSLLKDHVGTGDRAVP